MCRFPVSQNLNLPEIYDFMVAGPKIKTILSQSHIRKCNKLIFNWQFFVASLACLSDPFNGLSDLQLGDKKVTWNHLVLTFLFFQLFLQQIPVLQPKAGPLSGRMFPETNHCLLNHDCRREYTLLGTNISHSAWHFRVDDFRTSRERWDMDLFPGG